MTIQTALLQGTRLLEIGEISVPRLTAEVLLSFALRCERSYLYAHPEDDLSEVAWLHYGRYLHQRLKGKPTQYITHRQEFYGREFHVTTDVLIPRPETEHLVEAALTRISPGHVVVDVGCGSGAIGITLALEAEAPVYGSDISLAALRVAAKNSARLHARVSWIACDLASAFADSSIEMLVSNPPYVPRTGQELLQREVRDWEPPLALFAGPTGLEMYERLIAQARRVIKPQGWLLLELGYNSLESVRLMLADGWRDLEVAADLAGLPRVIAARRMP
ncbi:MAG: peptide chain release factor N(5)-glutamine methyltransferase [Acidobacteriota bacterium]|nr:peptide chain release factor N(5)-glutamine methyltransferase [Acidobacteriota bacterium]